MNRAYRTAFAASLAAVVAVLGACRDSGDRSSNDSALSRDLTLASAVATPPPALQDTPEPTPPRDPVPTVTRPAPRETPARQPQRPAPAPVRQAPPPVETAQPAPVIEPPVAESPAPAPEAPRVGVVAGGTSVGLVIGERACSDGRRPGDKMVAHTAEAITATNGVVFPAGSPVVIEIASIVEGGTADSSTITFRVKSITTNDETYPVTGDVVPTGTLEKTRVQSGSSDKKKVIGGAILGAVIGQVIGGDTKGTVIGAAAGAAAGTAAAARKARYQSCLPAGATLRLTFTEPIEVGTN